MAVGIGSGLGPDFHHIVGLGHFHAGQLQLHIAVSAAGVGDFKDIGTLLQLCRSGGALADSGFPALGIGSGGIRKVKFLVDRCFGGLLGDCQSCVGFGGRAALVGNGVGQLIAAGGGRGGLAVLEVQGGHGFHGDLGADVAVFFIGGGDTCEGIKFRARFGEQILSTIDDRRHVLFFCAAGCQGSSQGKNQQNRNQFFHVPSPV